MLETAGGMESAGTVLLAVGQRVFAGGQVTDSVRDARLIVIRAAAKSAAITPPLGCRR